MIYCDDVEYGHLELTYHGSERKLMPGSTLEIVYDKKAIRFNVERYEIKYEDYKTFSTVNLKYDSSALSLVYEFKSRTCVTIKSGTKLCKVFLKPKRLRCVRVYGKWVKNGTGIITYF